MKINYIKGSEVCYPVRFSVNTHVEGNQRYGVSPYTYNDVFSEVSLIKIIRTASRKYCIKSSCDLFKWRFLSKSSLSSNLLIIDSHGFVVNPDYLFNKAFSKNKYKKPDTTNTPLYGYKKSWRGCMRYPETFQSLRESSFTYSCDEYTEPRSRGRRRKSYLPTAWDDLWRYNQKGWKKHRKSQWHK